LPLKASYLVLAGAGAIVVVAGFKGWGISQAVRDIIQGKNPATKQTAQNTITAAAYVSPSGGYTGGTNAPAPTGPVGPGETAFFTAVLLAIAAPPTAPDLTSLHNWRLRESPWNDQPPDGAQYTHNPLNTTLVTGGSSGTVNSVGVQTYSSAATGVAATAQTLLSGYPAIVSALRRGVGLATGDPSVEAELSTWSDGGYSSV
jgi:hypothetical protein